MHVQWCMFDYTQKTAHWVLQRVIKHKHTALRFCEFQSNMVCPNFVDTESDGRVDKLNAFDKHNYELEKVIQEVLMTGFMNVGSCSRPERQSKTYCCPKLIYNDNFSTKI